MKLSDIKKEIESSTALFCTASKQGYPNAIPVKAIRTVDNFCVITDNYMEVSSKNVRENPKVCLYVLTDGWKGYKIIGDAKYHFTGKWAKFIKEMRENREHPAKGCILIEIEKIFKIS